MTSRMQVEGFPFFQQDEREKRDWDRASVMMLAYDIVTWRSLVGGALPAETQLRPTCIQAVVNLRRRSFGTVLVRCTQASRRQLYLLPHLWSCFCEVLADLLCCIVYAEEVLRLYTQVAETLPCQGLPLRLPYATMQPVSRTWHVWQPPSRAFNHPTP